MAAIKGAERAETRQGAGARCEIVVEHRARLWGSLVTALRTFLIGDLPDIEQAFREEYGVGSAAEPSVAGAK